jgi:hypothetical protein
MSKKAIMIRSDLTPGAKGVCFIAFGTLWWLVAAWLLVYCGVRDKIKEKHLSISSMDVVKGD